MAVIGIDPGTALTGYGIVEELPDKSLHLIDFGVIRTDSKDKQETRLRIIFSAILVPRSQSDKPVVSRYYLLQKQDFLLVNMILWK